MTACNPLTYVSEGMRAAWCPTSPTSSPGCGCWSLVATIVVSLTVGIRLFLRRAVD